MLQARRSSALAEIRLQADEQHWKDHERSTEEQLALKGHSGGITVGAAKLRGVARLANSQAIRRPLLKAIERGAGDARLWSGDSTIVTRSTRRRVEDGRGNPSTPDRLKRSRSSLVEQVKRRIIGAAVTHETEAEDVALGSVNGLEGRMPSDEAVQVGGQVTQPIVQLSIPSAP